MNRSDSDVACYVTGLGTRRLLSTDDLHHSQNSNEATVSESWKLIHQYTLAGDNTSKTQTTTNEKPWIKSSASKFVFPKNILPLLLVLFIANMRVDIRLVVIFIQSNDFNDFTVDKWYRLHHHISVISVLLFHSSMSITSVNQHWTSWSCRPSTSLRPC